MTPAIAVIAYQRPRTLQRLLASMLDARYPAKDETPLVVSVDRGQGSEWEQTLEVARDFSWPFGPKEVMEQPRRLGLVGHFYECGRLSRGLGDLVILEDDLSVSPAYVDFASSALDAYRDDERIAGVCLYGLWFNGFTREPFLPLADGSDAFFLGVPHTQGLAFTRDQWDRFDSWPGGPPAAHPAMHPAFLDFGPNEWYPRLASYVAVEGRYFCFPRTSLTAGWGDRGTHFGASTSWFQTPLQATPRSYRLAPLDECLAVYDGFYELLPERMRSLARALPEVSFDVDLNATKGPANLRHDQVLTTRPSRAALASFGLEMYPPELNIANAVPGGAVSLARVEDVVWDAPAGHEARRRIHEYLWRHHKRSRRRSLTFAAARILEILRQRNRQK